jgi:hypothetical protein
MTSPQHLWSGDWERDSAAVTAQLIPPTPPALEREVHEPEPPRRRRSAARLVACAVVACVRALAALVRLVWRLGRRIAGLLGRLGSGAVGRFARLQTRTQVVVVTLLSAVVGFAIASALSGPAPPL